MARVSNLNQLIRDIEAAKKLIRADVTKHFRDVAGDILTGCVEGTPEDRSITIGDWQVGVDATPTGTIDHVDPAGAQAIASGLTEIETAALGTKINIVNNQPYVDGLNAGNAVEKPAGWVEASVDRAIARKP